MCLKTSKKIKTTDKMKGCADDQWMDLQNNSRHYLPRRILVKVIPRQLFISSLFPHFGESVRSLASAEPPHLTVCVGLGSKGLSSIKYVMVDAR